MLQYVHEVRRDGFVKQEGLRPGLADIDAAFFADGGLLIGLLRVDLLLQLCLQDGRADRESVRDGLLKLSASMPAGACTAASCMEEPAQTPSCSTG